MTDLSKAFRAYSVESQWEPGKRDLDEEGWDEEIIFGFYDSGERGEPELIAGEFRIHWEKILGKTAAQLLLWDEVFELLPQMQDVFFNMKKDTTPEQFIGILNSLGFRDITRRERS